MRRYFLIFGFLFFLFTTCCLAQEGDKALPNPVNPPQEEAVWDFGQVKEGLMLQHDFIFKNKTERALNITGTNTSCGCTISKVEKNTLSPGEETKIEAHFNSVGYSGVVEQFVYINTDDPQNPVSKFTIKAEVIQAPAGQYATWDFGKIKEGEIVTHNFSVKNQTHDTLNILQVKTSCGCTGTKIQKNTLLAGEETILEVQFNSKGFPGRAEKRISVQTDDPANPLLTFTIKAEVVK